MSDVTAVAVACMMKGLNAEEADRVWDILKGNALPWRPSDAMVQLDAAIERVRPERTKEPPATSR